MESQAHKNSQKFRDAKTELYHKCLAAFFKPLIDTYKAGGFYLEVNGTLRCFVPVFAFFVQDNAEGNALSGVVGSWNCYYPCRICLTPFKDMNNPLTDKVLDLRLQGDAMELLQPVVSALKVIYLL